MKKITSFINGKWSDPSAISGQVLDKYNDNIIAEMYESNAENVDQSVEAANDIFENSKIDIENRIAILERAAALIRKRKEEFIDTIIAEGGQTLVEATKEVERASQILELTATEASRIDGELLPTEGMKGGKGKFSYMKRFPLGVVCVITAFNSPLSTPIHKIAPALAAGNSVVMKPPRNTPISSALLCDVFKEAGLPNGWLNYVHGKDASVGEQLLADSRIKFYHFTGSTDVGKHIASKIGMRQCSLELGNISATIVCDDADIKMAAKDIARGGFAKAGQVCTSPQIIYAENQVYDQIVEELSKIARKVIYGDPKHKSTQVGPMISESAAIRICDWIEEAKNLGGKCLTGGTREGAVVSPSILIDVPIEAKLRTNEAFGPVIIVVPIKSALEAIQLHNTGEYGLAAGIFTRDIKRAFTAAEKIRVGTVHINASNGRMDAMPFGGIKNSGHGKEGPKYAIEEMTEQRLVIWHDVI